MKERRKTIGQFSVSIQREKLDALTKKLETQNKTKTQSDFVHTLYTHDNKNRWTRVHDRRNRNIKILITTLFSE